MASVTNLTDDSSEVDASSYVTASFSPTPNALTLAIVAGGPGSGPSNTPTASGLTQTWTQVITQEVSSLRRVTVFRSLTATPGSGALTFDFGGQTQVRAFWAIIQIQGTLLSGTNGADAIVQTAHNESATTATGITVTLGAFAKGGNMPFGAVLHGSNDTVTVGSGFSEITNKNSTDSGVLCTEYKYGQDTTVDWSWPSRNDNQVAVALEIALADNGISTGEI